MSKFGAAKAGWGKATQLYKAWKKSKAQAKMKSGTSTREERIKYGERSPDIKAVKPTKDIKGSVERGKSDEYLRRIRKLDKAETKVQTGKKMMQEGQKERKQMKDTGTAFQFRDKKSYHPIEPGDVQKFKIKKGVAGGD